MPKSIKNRITQEIRNEIADEIIAKNLIYNGKVRHSDFLNRLFDLKEMPSTDYRPEYNNAYKDIYQHADMNPGDWDKGWVFTDERLNLTHCADEVYLKFLDLTVNPAMRDNDGTAKQLIDIYNKSLKSIGIGFQQEIELQNGAPKYSRAILAELQSGQTTKSLEIKRYLDSDYVKQKIDLMNQNVDQATDIAIGTGKELLETVCKSVLKQKNVMTNKDWTLSQLIKNTITSLDVKPKTVANPENAERSIRQILGGIASIVQGISELRNSYGSGHGKDDDFKGLDPIYARLFIAMVADISLFILNLNGKAELEE
ncbi:abortive infection family protein [Sphingobacterium faecale]|uniref:Abortive infection family protein n=1 Tax=Sphingobacterium faecale TaxID=2803775 RepID=A0ABS1RB79_9SPHI|nr:abortive infection family protein [Sphingobacterium faecale]MBL1411101.1 abortive infection family protein [Sphingobacterium faecale]